MVARRFPVPRPVSDPSVKDMHHHLAIVAMAANGRLLAGVERLEHGPGLVDPGGHDHVPTMDTSEGEATVMTLGFCTSGNQAQGPQVRRGQRPGSSDDRSGAA